MEQNYSWMWKIKTNNVSRQILENSNVDLRLPDVAMRVEINKTQGGSCRLPHAVTNN